jgi:hypothetical protein
VLTGYDWLVEHPCARAEIRERKREIQKWNAEWTFADRHSTSREIWEVDIKVRSFVVGIMELRQ